MSQNVPVKSDSQNKHTANDNHRLTGHYSAGNSIPPILLHGAHQQSHPSLADNTGTSGIANEQSSNPSADVRRSLIDSTFQSIADRLSSRPPASSPQKFAAQPEISTPIARPSIRTDIISHSPSTNIARVGTPFPTDTEPFQYPFPDAATTAANSPETNSFSSAYPTFADSLGSLHQPSWGLYRPPSRTPDSSGHPRLRPPPTIDPPIPPSLEARRHLFSLNLLPSRATRPSEPNPSVGPSMDPNARKADAPNVSQARDNNHPNEGAHSGSAPDPRNNSQP